MSGSRLSRRTLLRAAGGLGAAGALAACGSNTGRKGGAASKTALSQWYHQYGETGTQQAAQRYAKSYPDATVTIQWIPGDYDSKVSSGLLSNSGPDVFEWHFNIQMAKSGQVVPLDDIIGDTKSDFSQQDIDGNSWDGKLYGIRMIDDPQLLYYRKSMLDKANLSPPSTFDELVNAAEALSTKKVKGLFLGNDGGVGVFGDLLLWSTGQNYLTPDHKVGFNTDITAQALTQARALSRTKTLLIGAPADWWEPDAFNQGLCAITRNGLWAMPAIQKALGDDFGVIPFPKFGDSGKPAVYSGGWTAFVSSKAKNVDAAKKFLKWLWIDSTADQEDWSLSYGFHIPPRKSIAAKASKLSTGAAADALQLNEQYGVVDDPAWTPAMRTAYGDAVTNVVLKGANPQQSLATAQSAVNTELGKLFG